MKLRKDDPIYYQQQLNSLLKQAFINHLTVTVEHLNNGAKIYFKSDNGDVAGCELLGNKIN